MRIGRSTKDIMVKETNHCVGVDVDCLHSSMNGLTLTDDQTQLLLMQYTICRKFYLDKSLDFQQEWNSFMFGSSAPHFPFFKDNGYIDTNYFSYGGTTFNMNFICFKSIPYMSNKL